MSLPDSINYTKIKPLSVESRSRRRQFLPENGQRFTSTTNNIIRIPISASAFLDTKHSYLRFTLNNTTGQTLGMDFTGGSGCFQRMRVLQQGTVLSDVQEYGRLVGAVIYPSTCSQTHVGARSISDAQRYLNSAIGGAAGGELDPAVPGEITGAIGNTPSNANDTVAGGANYIFSIPLVNGLLGSTQDKLVPLQLLNSTPIILELTLSNVLDIGVFGGVPAAFTLQDIRYMASLVEVGREVDDHLRQVQAASGGRLILNGVDFSHYTGNLAPNTLGQTSINVPCRRRSIKNFFFVGASRTYAGGGAQQLVYNQSYGGHLNLRDFQLKAGSTYIPPLPVDAQFFGGGNALARAQVLEELAKCWGETQTSHGNGVLNRINYAVTPGDNAGMAVQSAGGAAADTLEFTPFGLDLEAFGPDGSGAQAIECGLDTATNSIPLSLNINLGAVIPNNEAVIIDMYVCYDSLYWIDQVGNIRVSI